MKKIKFLSCGIMAAFMTLGLASCEEENFNVKPDVTINPPTIKLPTINGDTIIVEAGNAAALIQPKVNALINGNIYDVTSASTITFSSEGDQGEDKDGYYLIEKIKSGINGATVTINVKYKATVDGFTEELEATDKVIIPAMSAGSTTIVTPTIWLSVKTEAEYSLGEPVASDEPLYEEYGCYLENTSNYWYSDYVAKLTWKESGTQKVEFSIKPEYANDEDVKAAVEKYQSSLIEKVVEGEPVIVEGIVVYAQSLTIVPYKQCLRQVTYPVNKNLKWSRAEGEFIEVATITVTEYNRIETVTEEEYMYDINLQGIAHGHGHYTGHGHGHDHGHGQDNAGGGICGPM